MLTWIVFIACLSADPTSCREERTLFSAEPIGALECVVGAQPKLARDWAPMHPNHRIAHIRCVPDEKLDRPA